jgi:hypothetical protein
MLANRNEDFLIQREGAPYPPHHVGDHLEEAFIKFWENEGFGNRKLIPVHWTAVYNHRVKEGLGPGTPNGILRDKLRYYLDSLDRSEKYFVVCTHDDAPSEELPPNTIVFGAGGNSNKIDIPVPLTCSPHIKLHDNVRTLPISFVGSVTHQIRFNLLNTLYQKPGVMISADQWTDTIPEVKVDLFKRVAEQSIFSLCPRGYGATSYRLYESMQLGAIPVYISDVHILPWKDKINWEEFCFIVKPDEITHLHERLLRTSNTQVRKMQDNLIPIWEKYFSIHSTCLQIFDCIKNFNS